jgi:hypothetical protein
MKRKNRNQTKQKENVLENKTMGKVIKFLGSKVQELSCLKEEK